MSTSIFFGSTLFGKLNLASLPAVPLTTPTPAFIACPALVKVPLKRPMPGISSKESAPNAWERP